MQSAPQYASDFVLAVESDSPTGGGIGGSAGSGTSQAAVAPFGVSSGCGDAIVGVDEECDDGDDGVDACSASCRTRDQPVAPPVVPTPPQFAADRYLGAGRHPISGLDQGFVTSYMELGEEEPSVGATLFNIWGQRTGRVTVSDGASPLDDANPVAVALPGAKYAVAWSDFNGDGSDLGIALRRVAADGTLGAANEGAEFSQLNPDLLWTGTQLIAAWEDYADPSSGPDLRYRFFDADLNATSGDLTLAASGLPEAAVSLAAFDGNWAAAYREGTADGQENIVVKVGDSSFRVGPVFGGPLDDRPALVGLDATHWLVAFSVGTDPSSSGVYNLPRVRYSVVDTESVATPTCLTLDPLDAVFSYDAQIAQTTPTAARGPEGVYLAWRSEARPGDAAGDQIWLKYLRWVHEGVAWQLRAEETEMLVPRTCDGNVGDQRTPALASTQLPPGGALAIAWTDYARTQGNGSGAPEVLVHYAPTHLTSAAGAPQKVAETWSGPAGSAWPSRWSSNAASPVSLVNRYGQGEFTALVAPGSVLAWVNDHNARDVDIVTTVRFSNAVQYLGAFARRADSSPNNYVGAMIDGKTPDVWRTYFVAPDPVTNQPVTTFLQSMPVPKGFPYKTIGLQVDHRLRFQVVNTSDGGIFVGLKVWRLGAEEPVTWTLSNTYPVGSAVVTQLGNVAGRFGVSASVPTSNGGQMWFDDFSAKFFEGNVGGALDQNPSSVPLLLPREVATYRRCNGEHPCAVANGCCEGPDACASGLVCDRSAGEALGVGSDASTCVIEHCANLKKDATEARADCGGADCKSCSCTSSISPGIAGYCSPSCNCGRGEYPCTRDGDCLPGLVCGAYNGEPFGAAWDADACVPAHCMNRALDTNLGETAIDCGGECGSNCTCSQANGLWGHCRPYCPCGVGEGHCLNDQDCVAPLTCDVAKGPKYGFPAGTSACRPLSCQNNVKDAALGETSVDCGGACGCGGCPAGCE